MRRFVLASCVAAAMLLAPSVVEAANVRNMARTQRAVTVAAPAVGAASAVLAVSSADLDPLCLAKCAAEVAWCIHECDHPGMLGGCKEDCAGKGAACTALCVLVEPQPSPSPEPTPVRAVAPAVTPAAPKVIDASNIEAAFQQLTRSPLASSSEVAAPAVDGKCLAKCAMRLTLCIHVCDHPSGLLGGCKENCAAEAAECSVECALDEKAPVVAVAAPVAPVDPTPTPTPHPIDYKCLAKCASECGTCIYNCYPSFGLGGCKENCAATAALCTTECLLEENTHVPSVVEAAAKAVELVAVQPATKALVAKQQVGSADVSALCLAKCAAEVALCIYKCEHPSGLLGGCKLDCTGHAALCAAGCALADAAPAALPSVESSSSSSVVNSANVEATFAAQNAMVVKPSPAGPLAMPTVDYKCLAKCAAECAYCIYECEHPSGLLGGCKENCAATAAECSAECVLEEQSSEASAVIASSQKAVALVTASPAVVALLPTGVETVPTACLAKCAAEAALCVWDCEHPSFGLGGCKENCAATAAECSAECVLDASKPVVNADNIAQAFAGELVTVTAAAPAAKQVAVSEPSTIDYKCLAKCAAECAYCIYECEHPTFGLLGGCKENCAATAAECGAECVLEEPASAKAIVQSAEKAVALVEAPAVPQQVAAPMTAVCLAKCAAEAAYCVYECDHPSFGLGGCKEDCAGKAAVCSAGCVLAPAPVQPSTPALAAPVEADPLVVAALVPIVGAPEISALCLAKCAAELALCIHDCDHPSFGLGGCKEDCAGKSALCTAKCVLVEPTPPQAQLPTPTPVTPVVEKAVAPVVAAAHAVAPSVGSADISALCLAKCAGELALCIHDCDVKPGMLAFKHKSCKEHCAEKSAECSAKCAL